MILDVFIEGKRLDLFNDENIELNRSVQDIKDISKIYTDFTRSFTVPGSKNNNKIFKHFERPEIDNGYDTRTKKNGYININSLDFVTGKIRLEEVSLKSGKVDNYKITFFGNLVSLNDLLGEDDLSSLSWLSQFNHNYNYETIKQGLEDAVSFTVDGVVEKVIKYPLMSSEKRYIYSFSAGTETETISNIAYTANTPTEKNGFLWSDLKPAIGLNWVIKAIEDKYNIIFGGDFFNKEEFKKMNLWLSNEKGRAKMSAEGEKYLSMPDTTEYFSGGNLKLTFLYSIFGTPSPDYTYKITITPLTNSSYTVSVYDNSTYSGFKQPFIKYEDLTGGQILEGDIKDTSNGIGEMKDLSFYINSTAADTFDVEIEVNKWYYSDGSFSIVKTETSILNNFVLNAQVDVPTQMPDMKISDFLMGLFKVFNLTIVPNDGRLEIYNLQDWYNVGKIIDVSFYIDKDKTPVKRGNILSSVDLKFKEGKSLLINQFTNMIGRSYGDVEFIFRDEFGNKADGENLEIKVPFEQMIYEKIIDGVVYGYVTDDKEDPYNIGPHLMYINNTPITNTISIVDDLEEPNEVNIYNRPSHKGGFGISTFGSIFSVDLDEYDNTGIAGNLLSNYYLDYLTDVFNKRARLFDYKAKFPAHIIKNIKLNDRLTIDGRRYIINNMNINLLTKDVDLELINDIYRGETQDSLTNKMLLSSYSETYESPTSSGSFTYTTNEEVNYLKYLTVEDIGNGTAWITPTQTGNRIDYTVAENTSGLDRYTAIKITGRNLNDTYHKIKQNA